MINSVTDYEYAKNVAEPLFATWLKEQYPDYNIIKATEELDKCGYDIVMVNPNDGSDIFGFDVKSIPMKYRKDNPDKNCYSISEHSRKNSNPRRYYAFQEYDSQGELTGEFLLVSALDANKNVAVSKSSTATKKNYFISGKVIKNLIMN